MSAKRAKLRHLLGTVPFVNNLSVPISAIRVLILRTKPFALEFKQTKLIRKTTVTHPYIIPLYKQAIQKIRRARRRSLCK